MIEIKILLLSLAALLTGEVATAVIISQTTCASMLIIGVARLLEIMTLFLIVSTIGRGMSSIGLDREKILPGFNKGLIWSAAFGICALIGFAILYGAHINPLEVIKSDLPTDTQGLVLFFVVGGLIAPVAEEVFFRGIVYGFLRRWGVLLAIMGTTAVFAIAHPFGAGLPMTQIVGGIVFAVAYEVEGSLMVPITIHVLGNMAIFTLSMIS
jgi:membrane protease YdiL (CAAX protease family)